MPQYRLINPSIEGSLQTTYNEKKPTDAAEKVWLTLSKYITNSIPKFAFTLEDDKGKLHHYSVKEKMIGGGDVKFDIAQIHEIPSKHDTELKSRVNKFAKQRGGKKHHDDDSSSSSSSDDGFNALKLFKNKNTVFPITYWWYDPLVYNYNTFYTPTFVAPLYPQYEIYTSYYVL